MVLCLVVFLVFPYKQQHANNIQYTVIVSHSFFCFPQCASLLRRNCLKGLPLWRAELEQMLACGHKAELQAMCSLGLNYLADTLLPAKIQNGEWL